MVVGILTFHFGNNYGGILQCYALCNVLKKWGYDVRVINYKPSSSFYYRFVRKIKMFDNFLDLLKYSIGFLNFTTSVKKDINTSDIYKENILNEFDSFREKYLNLTEPVNEKTIGNICGEFDVVIVGSDQVWTSLYDKNSIYFLNFEPAFKGRKIAYAACSAHKFVLDKRKKELLNYLKEFNFISIRDKTTQDLVKNITGKNELIVADPTLLYDFDEFISLKETPPYILTYILGDDIKGGHYTALKKIKTKFGDIPVKSIIIPSNNTSSIAEYSNEVYYDLHPSEWVNMFANSTFVYTDSFHAIMFALKFDKPFIAYYVNQIRMSRLIDLKDRFGLTNIVNNAEEIKEMYISVSLDTFSKESLSLLKSKL